MNPAFVSSILPAAVEAANRTGIDPRIIVAQAALESAWGKSAPGNNLFGIKSHGKSGGQTLRTTEVVNGRPVKVNASFRRYADPAESVAGYADFMLENPRYREMRSARSLDEQIAALGRSGYATDPKYAEKIRGIVSSLPIQMADAGMSTQDQAPGIRKVTDPDMLRKLEPQAAAGGLRRVTDTNLLRRLEGGSPAAPEVIQTPDGPQPGQVLPEGGDRLANIRNVSPGGAALANLFLDPQQQTDIDDTLKLSLPQGATGGWSDEMMAWLQAAPKEGLRLLQGAFGADVPPSTFDQDYRRARTQTNVEQADLDRRAPGLSVAGMAAGALGSAAAVPSATGLASGTAGKVGLGALEGAAIGAGVAAGTADPGQRLDAAAEGAVGGAALGAAGTRAGVALERYLARRTAVRAAPSSEALKQASRDLYEAAANSGIVYRPQPVADLVTDVSARMADELIDPSLHPKASAVVKRLPELVNKPATLKEVERYRQLASDAARSAEPGSADQRLATMIVEALDEFTLDQSNMVATSGGAELQREARKLWSQYRKDQLVAFQVEKAARRAASTGSGGNVNNAIRQNIRSILDNRKLRQGFTPDEIRAMEEIVRGAPLDSFLRLAGKLSPSGNGLMLALQTGGAAATGGLSLPLAAAGHMAKTAADSATTRRVKSLAALIRSGAKPPFGQVSQLSKAERRALAKLTAGAGGEPLGEDLRTLADPETVR